MLFKYESCILRQFYRVLFQRLKLRGKNHDFLPEDKFTADYFLTPLWVWSNVTSQVHTSCECSHTVFQVVYRWVHCVHGAFPLSWFVPACLLRPAPLPLKFQREYIFKLFQNFFPLLYSWMQCGQLTIELFLALQVTNSPVRLHFHFSSPEENQEPEIRFLLN